MITLLLLNGGIGERLGMEKPKAIMRLNGVPLMIYSLHEADKMLEISKIILNYPDGYKDEVESLIKQYAIEKEVIYVEAGKTRQESVYKMLEYVDTKTVLIHESARPNITIDDFKQLLEHEYHNVTQSLPIYSTVLEKKEHTDYIGKIHDRTRLVDIQLPQKFLLEELKEAHNKAKENYSEYTEDASLMFDNGFDVAFTFGKVINFKITTKDHFYMARYLNSIR